MQESYGEGVASHTGPKPCAGAREGMGEASAGVRAGRVWSRESNGKTGHYYFGMTLRDSSLDALVRLA